MYLADVHFDFAEPRPEPLRPRRRRRLAGRFAERRRYRLTDQGKYLWHEPPKDYDNQKDCLTSTRDSPIALYDMFGRSGTSSCPSRLPEGSVKFALSSARSASGFSARLFPSAVISGSFSQNARRAFIDLGILHLLRCRTFLNNADIEKNGAMC